jgi:hypothetical protein
MQLIAGEMTAKGEILRRFQASAIPNRFFARPGVNLARNEIGAHRQIDQFISKNVN